MLSHRSGGGGLSLDGGKTLISTAKSNVRRKKLAEKGLNDSDQYMQVEGKYVLKGAIKKTVRRYFRTVVFEKILNLKEEHQTLIERLEKQPINAPGQSLLLS